MLGKERRARQDARPATTPGRSTSSSAVGNYGEVFDRTPDADRHPARAECALDQGRAAILAALPLIRLGPGGRPGPAPHACTAAPARTDRAPPCRRPRSTRGSLRAPAQAAAAPVLVGRTGARHRLAGAGRRRHRRHRLVAVVATPSTTWRSAASPPASASSAARPGCRSARSLIEYSPTDTYLRALTGRPAEHAEGRGGRHRAGDRPRHAGRHRPAVAELAAGQDRRRLCRGDPRPAAAAAAAVLVRHPAGPARAAAGDEPGGGRVPVQPRAEAALDRVAGRAYLRAAGLPGRRRRHLAVAPRRAGDARCRTASRAPVWPVALGLLLGAAAGGLGWRSARPGRWTGRRCAASTSAAA